MKKVFLFIFDNLFFIASLFSVFLGLGYSFYGEYVLDAPSTLDSIYYSLTGAFLLNFSVLLFILGSSEKVFPEKPDKNKNDNKE